MPPSIAARGLDQQSICHADRKTGTEIPQIMKVQLCNLSAGDSETQGYRALISLASLAELVSTTFSEKPQLRKEYGER